MLSQYIVLKVLRSWRGALLPLLIRLEELNHLLEVEGVSCSQEHILLLVLVFCLSIFHFPLSVALAILTNLIVVLVVLIFVLITLLPFILAEFLILILHLLVNGHLDLWQGDITTPILTDNLLVDYPEVDFVEQLTVLVNVYGGRPLVSDPKQKLDE